MYLICCVQSRQPGLSCQHRAGFPHKKVPADWEAGSTTLICCLSECAALCSLPPRDCVRVLKWSLRHYSARGGVYFFPACLAEKRWFGQHHPVSFYWGIIVNFTVLLRSQPFDIIYSPYAGSAGTSGAAFHKRDYPFEPCTSSDQTLEWESRGRLPVEHSLLSDGDPFAVNTSLAFETRDVSLYQRRTSNLEEY